jgi:hypothetical protein
LSCSDFLGEAAGDELAEHRVQTAGDPVLCVAQIAVSSGQDLDDRGLIFGRDGTDVA